MTTSASGFRRLGLVLTGIGIVVSIIVITVVVGDIQKFNDLLVTLRWQIVASLIPLALLNHGLRYWRWETLLKLVASKNIKRSTAVLIFLSGSLLIFTPARIGEVAKSVYARDYLNIPIAKSLPVLVVERLADIIVMAILASLGLLLLGNPPNMLLGGIIIVAVVLVFVLRKPFLAWLARRQIVRRWSGLNLEQILELAIISQLLLVTPRALRTNLSFGFSAWAIEVLIYFLSLSAVGVPINSHLFTIALAVFPLASIAGSMSFLPGGLGITEGSLSGLAIIFGGFPQETVLLAALLSRAAILGVIVVAGFVSIPLLRRVPRVEWQ